MIVEIIIPFQEKPEQGQTACLMLPQGHCHHSFIHSCHRHLSVPKALLGTGNRKINIHPPLSSVNSSLVLETDTKQILMGQCGQLNSRSAPRVQNEPENEAMHCRLGSAHWSGLCWEARGVLTQAVFMLPECQRWSESSLF